MTAEQTVLSLVEEMHAWETWANGFWAVITGDVEDETFNEDSHEIEYDRRYFEVFDRYAIDRSVCLGITNGSPTGYDLNEQIISSEINGDEAIVRTKQTHRKKYRPNQEDPNYEVIFKLRKVGGEWKITGRQLVAWDGEVFDVGIYARAQYFRTVPGAGIMVPTGGPKDGRASEAVSAAVQR